MGKLAKWRRFRMLLVAFRYTGVTGNFSRVTKPSRHPVENEINNTSIHPSLSMISSSSSSSSSSSQIIIYIAIEVRLIQYSKSLCTCIYIPLSPLKDESLLLELSYFSLLENEDITITYATNSDITISFFPALL